MRSRDQVVQAERVERRVVGNRKHGLQTVQRAESDRLAQAVRGRQRNRRATQEKAVADHRAGSEGSACRDQRVEARKRRAAATRSEIGITDAELLRRTTQSKQAVNVGGLARRQVP
jgi:dephospho-CoA kinase